MRIYGLTVISLFFLVHIVILAVPIRWWPFHDYFMFSKAKQEFFVVSAFRLKGIKISGEEEYVEKKLFGGHGKTNFNVLNLIESQKFDQLEKLILTSLKKDYRKVQVVRRDLRRQPDNSFKETQTVMKEFVRD